MAVKKKVATPHHNTKTNKTKKNTVSKKKDAVPGLLKYYGLTYFDTVAMTQPVAERLAEDIFDTACKDTKGTITMKSFCKRRGIDLDVMYSWRKKFKCIDRACKAALPFIGDNREEGVLDKRMPERLVMRSMHQYCKVWKESDEWWAKLSKQERDLLEKIVFEMRELKPKDKDD